ncbi:hypothetical protein FQA39_LY04368 [Lamprigera yunnana]|nr:hypothetical protein FQA39_LY04368 [Lamprigera yunnana]
MFNLLGSFTINLELFLFIIIKAQVSQDMIEQGRKQFQLLQERKNLPTYGDCWKLAVQHIEESCQSLSEDSQSIIALHLANCFLEMSGHESYNCELEKKPNLKQICISSMSDRAFNVYTEFYTHTQSICWFLREQVWQETIADNTFRVGKQLETFANIQEDILQSQQESLDIQEKLLSHGHSLEKVMEKFYTSSQDHFDVLLIVSSTLKNLQSWLVGRFSWIDTFIFYVSTSIFIIIVTSSKQTVSARFPIWMLLLCNIGMESFIATYISNSSSTDSQEIYNRISTYIWWSRKTFYTLALTTLTYFVYYYQDLNNINNELLQKVYDQNLSILSKLEKTKSVEGFPEPRISIVQERRSKSPLLTPNSHEGVKNMHSTPKRTLKYNLRSQS